MLFRSRPCGVTCTLLAPGYVETEFAERADMIGNKLAQNGATAASVAKNGYDAMMAGKLVTINETMLGFAVNWIIPLLPTRMGMAMTAKLQAK